MDTKALAKSKRAHTLHNKTKNPHSNHHPKPKGTTSNHVGGKNKAVSKPDKERARLSKLPSNWDRYDDEEEDELQALPSDVILPKSKGADFRYLVSEAQAIPTDFLSLDHAFTGDIGCGLGSMLEVRGEGILSWIGEDNFVVDGDKTATNKASFLSLNLQALAEQLAKIDASERLFIEAELLPSEMNDQGSKTNSNAEPGELQLTMSEATTAKTEDVSKKDKLLNQDSKDILLAMSVGDHSESMLPEQESDTWNRAKVDLHYNQDRKSGNFQLVEQPTQISSSSVVDSKKKTSTLEPAGAEAELDMLLDSFSETKLLDSSGHRSGTPISEYDASPAQSRHTGNAALSTETTSIAANLDDALDNLLEETSNLFNCKDDDKPAGAGVKGIEINFPSSSSQNVGKSKVLDDFDSWFDTL